MKRQELIQNIMDLANIQESTLERLSYTTLMHLEQDLSADLKAKLDALTYEEILDFKKLTF